MNRKIWLTSDFHFNHDKEFIYKARGFETVYDMNRAIIKNFNEVVAPEDDVYVLGDLMLGGSDRMADGLSLIKQLNGELHIVRGNHDTDTRWEAYHHLYNVVECENAIYLKYQGHHFYMSHFPTFTANLEKETLKQCTLNVFGHTHQKTKFYNDIPFMYCVGLEAHGCAPVNIDDVLKDMYIQAQRCKEVL